MRSLVVALLVAVLISPPKAQAVDNGIGLTPPMGWRHWKAFYAHISQDIMEKMMDELVTKYPVDGVPTTLAELGYIYAGLDDHWQNCTRICANGSVVPSWLSGDYQCCKNAQGKCDNTGSHVLPWYDDDHRPMVDEHRFPDMKGMVAKAHGLGLRAGWYMGNYQCADGWPKNADIPALAKGSVDAIKEYGFDSVKLDSGFPVAANLSLWAQLLNDSGRPVMIENCHQGADGPGMHIPDAGRCTGLVGPDSVSDCPFNFWRTTGDPEPGWGTIMRELNTLRAVVNPAYASGKLTFLGVASCDADELAQRWNLTYNDDHSIVSVKSVIDGGCWEIPGCGGSSIDTDFGCKSLPKKGVKGCPANMAWDTTRKDGTITSVMNGNCLTVTGGSRIELSACKKGAASQQWVIKGGADGGETTINEAGGAKRCAMLNTTPNYNTPSSPLSRPGGWAYPGTVSS
jgi:hypothetical protein